MISERTGRHDDIANRIRSMKRILTFIVLTLATGACIPVSNPQQWDPTVYCATVRPPDPWCKAHGY